MEEIYKKYILLNKQNVPRETLLDFESFIAMMVSRNKEINLISKKTANNETIRARHIIDSAQIIDFVDLNNKILTDIGSGGGMPGIILAIMTKNMKKTIKINLYEKSHHKSLFLREVAKKLSLNAEVIQKNIFNEQNLDSGTIMTRAFKPLPIVLDLVFKNFKNYKNLILFMGKNGEEVLEKTLDDWNFDFEKKKSITSENSFLLNIKNIKKKNKN